MCGPAVELSSSTSVELIDGEEYADLVQRISLTRNDKRPRNGFGAGDGACRDAIEIGLAAGDLIPPMVYRLCIRLLDFGIEVVAQALCPTESCKRVAAPARPHRATRIA